MGSSLEKIDLRIILLCKKNGINFKIHNENINELIYNLDNYKLGFIKIVVKTNNESRVEALSIYGINEELFKIANQIENENSFFGLEIQNSYLSRIDFQNSILNVTFDTYYINEFEKSNADSQLKYKENIFVEEGTSYIPHKTAYNKDYSFDKNDIILMSKKFYRPEFRFIKFEKDAIPDENGNINCLYCVNCKNCKNCIGCIGCEECEDCTNCIECIECRNCYDSIECNNCDYCVDCNGCTICTFCDGLIARTQLMSCEPYTERLSAGSLSKYNFFPDSGSSIYHEKIESFFLINHFVPYHRPYENADNYNWNINWRITKQHRRYWITEETSSRFEKRIYTLTELSKFVLLNKMQYQNWEFEMYVKEYYNMKDISARVSVAQELFYKILFPTQDSSQTYYDEILTKCPNECIYNDFLYGKNN